MLVIYLARTKNVQWTRFSFPSLSGLPHSRKEVQCCNSPSRAELAVVFRLDRVHAITFQEPTRMFIFGLRSSTLWVSASDWDWLTSFLIPASWVASPHCTIYILFFGIGFCSVIFLCSTLMKNLPPFTAWLVTSYGGILMF